MQRAADRFEASANRVARYGTGLADVDLASEMVNVLESKHDFAANAKVVKVVSDMQKSAIDILA
jgi:flagellar basal body rod protein FlgC